MACSEVVLQEQPFVILMVIFMLGEFAFTVQAALLPSLIQYQLGMASQLPYIMIGSLIMTGLFFASAKLLADKIDKRPTYALGLTFAILQRQTLFYFF